LLRPCGPGPFLNVIIARNDGIIAFIVDKWKLKTRESDSQLLETPLQQFFCIKIAA
jgi:hypothetical protein